MRRPILAANWKMYKTGEEARAFAAELLPQLPAAGISGGPEEAFGPEAVICPPFTALSTLAEALSGAPVALGGQNLYPQEQGAFTGEIAPAMLRDLGCTYVILGHSERRQYFGETDEFINQKVRAAFAAGLIPILCLGETLEQRQAGGSLRLCLEQLTAALAGVTKAEATGLVIAYEPVWAIGTGLSAEPEDAQELIGALRERLGELYGGEVAAAVRIQYGGSVKAENIAAYLAMPDIDGALIGGAGLDASSFARILKIASATAAAQRRQL